MLRADNRIRDSELRRELERITRQMIRERVGEQVAAIGSLRSEKPHGIELVVEAIPGRPETFRYTCFQFAFGLVDPPESVVRICTLTPHIYPGSEFVAFLIDNAITEVRSTEVVDGDIVIYFANGRAAHAGVIDGNRLVSKWGLAHLWRHGIDEVPTSYGGEIRAFRPIGSEEAVLSFLAFAELQSGAGRC